MATVTGTLSDFGYAALAAFDPEIIFTPSGPAVSSGKLLATKPIVVTPAANGTFSVLLETTDRLRPATWYSIRIQWLDADGGFIGVDFPDWRLFVPAAGGVLTYLLNVPSSPDQVWVDELEPESPSPGLWWLNPSTGDLYEWSN